MNRLNSFTMHASKVIEVFFFVLAAILIISVIASAIALGWANGKIKEENIDVIKKIEEIAEEKNFDLGDTPKVIKDALEEENLLRKNGTINPLPIVFGMIYGIFSCAAFGMIFRNINLILKTARGKTWFSTGETPFQKDITRMIREIGIFLLLLTAIGFIISFFTTFVNGINLLYIVIGVLMLCLSSFFSYGEQLQQENDGLI